MTPPVPRVCPEAAYKDWRISRDIMILLRRPIDDFAAKRVENLPRDEVLLLHLSRHPCHVKRKCNPNLAELPPVPQPRQDGVVIGPGRDGPVPRLVLDVEDRIDELHGLPIVDHHVLGAKFHEDLVGEVGSGTRREEALSKAPLVFEEGILLEVRPAACEVDLGKGSGGVAAKDGVAVVPDGADPWRPCEGLLVDWLHPPTVRVRLDPAPEVLKHPIRHPPAHQEAEGGVGPWGAPELAPVCCGPPAPRRRGPGVGDEGGIGDVAQWDARIGLVAESCPALPRAPSRRVEAWGGPRPFRRFVCRSLHTGPHPYRLAAPVCGGCAAALGRHDAPPLVFPLVLALAGWTPSIAAPVQA
mmetsp:Transcript_38944/g.95822  ORF Transcript_38944/g.95822 Transcript_38944/m.95822 type:complete len:356 (-) Transcript_38944:70-1137(-)|eukprot:CAMPEP_0206220818 /NCGR_PEP_ID=MMETSP0047_2-20121206/5080_1 /ASSEMBLY_ACC=CAM_ASM_000192 /TAXON_ID=195065 /ORGANISM="Chroomonas mesostigmatica_cf, Strain CCMP1168" /LENGTH=355 /DNA_ID=CAMNT_0053643503 /DNA_START=428 /DNA_END=1495 /DNA_ORIENTATION=+